MRTRDACWITAAVLAFSLSISSRDGHGKPAAKGYWCFTLGSHGGESSACTRSEAKCTSAAETARSLGARACAFQESAWSTVTKEAGKSETYLFAKKEHCEQHREGIGGTACKEIK